MAAGKPIVSTPVADVITNFTPIVKVARDADEFVATAAALAAAPDAATIARGIDRARAASWESIVGQMQSLIHEAVTTTDAAIAAEEDADAAAASAASTARSSSTIGAAATSSTAALTSGGELSA
jgi:hypothetical protein